MPSAETAEPSQQDQTNEAKVTPKISTRLSTTSSGPNHVKAEVELLGPCSASKAQRTAYRRIVSIYERALAVAPYNYALWRDYLVVRSADVLCQPRGGTTSTRKRMLQASLQNLDVGPTLLDRETGEAEEHEWEAKEALDGRHGFEEWRSLAATFERAIRCLPKMPRFWLLYVSIFFHPKCPQELSGRHAKLTSDCALRASSLLLANQSTSPAWKPSGSMHRKINDPPMACAATLAASPLALS
ncbi:pre-mRNA-splicing factor syf1 [Tilletia horrida]|uniref:Pre-mRNA-splicing factor syf1 n=1 Tax=Tilletia horrida TaxID=155126 RepID=A0AAN6G3F2_9BASI|nr:pre-mRNA-splicing factor syf1 [Tilletia horrida]